MRNLLVGNGVDIQFGGLEYRNDNILKRLMKNIENESFNKTLYSTDIKEWITILHKCFFDLIDSKYDRYAITTYEREALDNLKVRYSSRGYKQSRKIKYTDIGIEDYMLINTLVCRQSKKLQECARECQELLKRSIIDSIYNSGDINKIYLNFPIKFKVFLESYNQIFTTNYDKNIEIFSKKNIQYLHGAFHILDSVYDKNSLRNKLSDAPINKIIIPEGQEHLFSNALMSFSGWEKGFSMNGSTSMNNFLEIMKKGINANDSNIVELMEKLKKQDSNMAKNLCESIELKHTDDSLRYTGEYPRKVFENISGEIDILGLSPNNDNHLFEMINNNIKIDKVKFYYYEYEEIKEIKRILFNKTVEVSSVKKLWESYE